MSLKPTYPRNHALDYFFTLRLAALYLGSLTFLYSMHSKKDSIFFYVLDILQCTRLIVLDVDVAVTLTLQG